MNFQLAYEWLRELDRANAQASEERLLEVERLFLAATPGQPIRVNVPTEFKVRS